VVSFDRSIAEYGSFVGGKDFALPTASFTAPLSGRFATSTVTKLIALPNPKLGALLALLALMMLLGTPHCANATANSNVDCTLWTARSNTCPCWDVGHQRSLF
jgi:hypothetical protein